MAAPSKRRRWLIDIGLASVAVAVVAFALWARAISSEVEDLRRQVTVRVHWLMALDALEGAGEDADHTELAELATLLRDHPAALGHLPDLDAPQAAIRQQAKQSIAAALRKDNAALSRALGTKWSEISYLLNVSLVLVGVIMAAVVLHRRALSRLDRAEHDRGVERQRRRLAEQTLIVREGVLASVGVAVLLVDGEGRASAVGQSTNLFTDWRSVQQWWQHAEAAIETPDTEPCPVCGGPCRSGTRIATLPDPEDPCIERIFEVTFGGHAHTVDLAPGVVLIREVTAEHAVQLRLKTAERLAMVGTLAAGIAHEINNPLASVTLNLDLLTEQLARDEVNRVLRDALDDARTGAARVAEKVRDLPLIASEAERLSPVDFGAVVASAIHMARGQLSELAEITYHQAERLPKVLASEARLGQIVLSAVFASCPDLDPGGPVPIEVRSYANNDGVFLEVERPAHGDGAPSTRDVQRGLSLLFRLADALGGRASVTTSESVRTIQVCLQPIDAQRHRAGA